MLCSHFDLWRNHCIENVALFEENSILLLPERLESSGWQLLKVEVFQESQKQIGEIGETRHINSLEDP